LTIFRHRQGVKIFIVLPVSPSLESLWLDLFVEEG
jgi:hypothetical protein